MIEKFKMDGNDAEYDTETRILKCSGINFNNVSPQIVEAKVNKSIRDSKNRGNVLKLNIGCGFRPFDDYINLDYDPNVYPDIVRNIEEGLPFDSDKFEEVYSSHVIEHVVDVFFYMAEIWRVCKNKAKVKIIAPYCGFLEWAIQPDHVRLINWEFMNRWRPEHYSVQNELKQTRKALFKIVNRELINEGREIVFDLEVFKNGVE